MKKEKHTKEPIVLQSNQNDAMIDDSGICFTLCASMGMGGLCANDSRNK